MKHAIHSLWHDGTSRLIAPRPSPFLLYVHTLISQFGCRIWGFMSREENVYFLGCRFDTGSIEEAASGILNETWGRFKYVVTPNVHHMVKLAEDPKMQPLYDGAWRVFCDSRVLSRLAWLSGLRLPVITGSDLTALLIARAQEERLTIALVGPTAGECDTLAHKYPDLKVECHTPPMGFITSELEVQKCVDFVVRTRAPLVFLAVGMPQQELLAGRIADHPESRGVGLCIGASIDFLTGKQHRAPAWVQRAGLEWLHRLLSDPRRLASRYLVECPRIFYLAFLKRKSPGDRNRSARTTSS
jgi:N-acetylglucosaminyldiphosphoundecaprenol N-acetyl-beta-D-mannosaminyltransferase